MKVSQSRNVPKRLTKSFQGCVSIVLVVIYKNLLCISYHTLLVLLIHASTLLITVFNNIIISFHVDLKIEYSLCASI